MRLLIAAAALGAAALLLAVGAAVALLAASSSRDELRQVAQLRGAIDAQRGAITSFEREAHRDLDALALQLGQLQAQATRLNALGERLTRVGKLDDGEFDFSFAPGVGGPEEPGSIGLEAPLPFQQGLDELRAEFDRQAAQLDVLENLLRNRQIDRALLPSGMPIAQGYVSSTYGGRTDPINGHSSLHSGVDFAAPLGTPVLSVADGLVTFADVRSGYGKVVEVDHGNGYVTRYAHNSALEVRAGQRVRAGEVIAKVGSSGRSTGPHCHFEVWRDGRAVNPMIYVRASGSSGAARG